MGSTYSGVGRLEPRLRLREDEGVEDEVRPVTALFADIVGSTALGERLLPEEVKALVGECMTRLGGAVEEFGGTVQAYQGDGICALFGVPAAHADDPERAARAALRILEIVGSYSRTSARRGGSTASTCALGSARVRRESGLWAWRRRRRSRWAT
jgi:class 3 adenylate cyclase